MCPRQQQQLVSAQLRAHKIAQVQQKMDSTCFCVHASPKSWPEIHNKKLVVKKPFSSFAFFRQKRLKMA